MENLLGLLRIRLHRGINLALRDSLSSSDPYVFVSFGEQACFLLFYFSLFLLWFHVPCYNLNIFNRYLKFPKLQLLFVNISSFPSDHLVKTICVWERGYNFFWTIQCSWREVRDCKTNCHVKIWNFHRWIQHISIFLLKF